jgi:hypothetical protein
VPPFYLHIPSDLAVFVTEDVYPVLIFVFKRYVFPPFKQKSRNGFLGWCIVLLMLLF